MSDLGAYDAWKTTPDDWRDDDRAAPASIERDGAAYLRIDLHESELAASRREVAALRDLVKAAGHALRSYQYGNSAPDLAAGIADRCDTALLDALAAAEKERDIAIARGRGAEERAQLVFAAKNEWADRARASEARERDAYERAADLCNELMGHAGEDDVLSTAIRALAHNCAARVPAPFVSESAERNDGLQVTPEKWRR